MKRLRSVIVALSGAVAFAGCGSATRIPAPEPPAEPAQTSLELTVHAPAQPEEACPLEPDAEVAMSAIPGGVALDFRNQQAGENVMRGLLQDLFAERELPTRSEAPGQDTTPGFEPGSGAVAAHVLQVRTSSGVRLLLTAVYDDEVRALRSHVANQLDTGPLSACRAIGPPSMTVRFETPKQERFVRRGLTSP